MRKISVFNLVSVDGFFAGTNGEIDWFNESNEDADFTRESLATSDTIIFGHKTYEIMASYWPSTEAMKNESHALVEYMNNTPKIVFSKTLQNIEDIPNWKNVRVFKDINPEEIINLKQQQGLGIIILGSGSIMRQFANFDLIDEYQLMVNPVILGAGKTLFMDFKKTKLRLTGTRTFKNGNVLLIYET